MKPKVAVMGSVNMDLVARVQRFPRPGETISGDSFDQVPGGKGANQAVASARLGADVSFYGAVGRDNFGSHLLDRLEEDEINTGGVAKFSGSTGVALITVDETGENEIVIIAGANGKVDRSYCDRVLGSLKECDVLLCQLEIPLPTVVYALNKLSESDGAGPITVLDPAPAVPAHELPLDSIDFLTPNQSELEILLGPDSQFNEPEELFRQGLGRLVVKRGSEGSELVSGERRESFPAYEVTARDTTAAGDAFNGALAVALARGVGVKSALKVANAAGALAVTVRGAQPSMPSLEEVQNIMGQ